MKVRYCDICCELLPEYADSYHIELTPNKEETTIVSLGCDEAEICATCASAINTFIKGKQAEVRAKFHTLGRIV